MKGVSLADSKGQITITFGRTSKALKAFKVDKDREELSFTISAKSKSGKPGYELNLQASTKEEILQFVKNLNIIKKDFQVEEFVDDDEEQAEAEVKAEN